MQITVDPAALTNAQREHLALFIQSYPDNETCSGTCGHAVAELAALEHDHESTLPNAAFGTQAARYLSAIPSHELDASAAFGAAPAPLPLGATAAPFTAVVAPLPTALVAMPVTTSIPAPIVPVPPAPAAPVPMAPAAPGNPAAGVELDAKGLPWDARIHAGSKAKIADGTWRSKRDLDPAIRASVEAELRQLMGAPAAPLVQSAALAPTPAPGAVSTIAPSAPTGAVPLPVAPPGTAAPVVGAAPSTQAAPNAAQHDARAQFVALVGRASAAIQAQKVTQAEITQCCAEAGVPALPLLANRLDLVAQVAAHIDALLAARQ